MKFLSLLYGFAVFVRNKLYDWKIFKSKKVGGVEIICVGNIVAGGTGKTPAVQYFVQKYLEKNKKVGILSRGYNGKRKNDLLLVRDENKIYTTAKESGDEAYLHALNFKIPVVVCKNRYEGATFLKEKYEVDTIIMDDGFQHRKLEKNKNIILIDATNPFGKDEYLPKGRLRESLDALYRADEIIITKSNFVQKEDIKKISERLKKYGKPIFVATFEESFFYKLNFENEKKFGKINNKENLQNNSEIFENEKKSLKIIENKKVLIFSSIANPSVFYQTIKNLRPESIDEMKFSDHHNYTADEISEIKERSKNYDFVLTTEKDIVKINENIENLLILKMEFKIVEKVDL